MRHFFGIFLFLLSFTLLAAEHSLTDFKYKKGVATFVDFKNAHYKIVFDFQKKSTLVTSTIEFYQETSGHPVFDLHNTIYNITVDSKSTSAQAVQPPSSETTVMVLSDSLTKGSHKLVMQSILTDYTGPIFTEEKYLDFFFSLNDLSDREFLEIYVPSSFEYDKVKMTFEIELKGTKTQHKLYNNGSLKTIGLNHFIVTFPDYFTTSSPYLHLVKNDLYHELNFEIDSMTGRKIPVTIYSDSLEIAEKTKAETLAVVAELEETIAPWPHPALLIQVYEGGAGMEYAGALVGGDEAIRHEIIHSYFARGVMPPDGKSAWIDESLTGWIENGYLASSNFARDSDGNIVSPRVNNLSIYKRDTLGPDYWGEYFFSYLNLKFSYQGGLKKFLPYLFNKYKFQFVTTEILKQELEHFYSVDLTQDFATYIY